MTKDGTYLAGVKHNGKHIHLGSYLTELQARKAMKKYLIEHNLIRE